MDERRMREIAREEAERTLREQTIPSFPAYFINGRWLVTYDWLRAIEQHLQHEIDALKRPWWKRWISR